MITNEILQVLEIGLRNGYAMGLDHAFWPAYVKGLIVGIIVPPTTRLLFELARYGWKRWQARRATPRQRAGIVESKTLGNVKRY